MTDDTTPARSALLGLPGAALLLVVLGLPLGWTALRGATAVDWLVRNQVSTLVNTAVWVVGTTAGAVLVGVVLAVLLHGRRAGAPLRGLLLVPAAVSLTVVAVAWRALFAFRPAGRSQVGLANEVTGIAGLAPVAWLTQEPLLNTVLLAAALAWVAAGIVAVVLLAHLDGLPRPADGRRTRWRDVRTALLPAMRRPLAVVALAVAVAAVRAHDVVRVATDGSFGTQVLSTEAIDQALVRSQPARGAALGLVLVLLVAPLAALLVRRLSRDERAAPASRGRHSRGRHSRGRLSRDGSDGRPAVEGDRAGHVPTPSARRPVGATGIVAVLVLLLPLIGLVVTALRPAADVAADGWWNVALDPRITLDNLRTVLGDGPTGGMWRATTDTLAVAVPAVLLTTGLALVSADALLRLPPGPARVVRALLVVAALVPLGAVLPPLAEALDAVGLHGSAVAAWLVHAAVGLPVAVLLIGGGHGNPGSSIPVARVAAAASVQFVLVWGDLIVASTVIGDGADRPVPVSMRVAALVSSRGEELHLVAAACVVALVVPVVVVLSMRPTLERLVAGGDRRDQDVGVVATS